VTTPRRALLTTIAAGAALAITACAPPSSSGTSSSSSSVAASSGATAAVAPKDATSAAAAGGLDALIAAAKKEGTLNVIALPPEWANYGEILPAFTAKYGIKINSANPEGSSQEEINAVNQLKGTDRAPDVLDLGMAVTLANTSLYAPYQVATWKDVPDAKKDATGLWIQDYSGTMSIGYDSAKVPAPTSVADLLKPDYKGKVALNGDPTQANAALLGVMMTSIAQGGSADDVSKGVDFFKQLKAAGNFVPLQATPATVKNGTTPVVIDWDYLNAGQVKAVPTWKVVVPSNAVLSAYYAQAISKNAPHPAAARLWEEFLFSDEGQNLYLKGGTHPVRFDAMTTAGTLDPAAAKAVPAVSGTAVLLTPEQNTKAKAYLAANWSKAIS